MTSTDQRRSKIFARAAVASGSGLLFALSLVLLSYIVEGSTLATRSATDLVMPVGLIWLASFSSAVFFALNKQWAAAVTFAIGFIFVGITANSYVASRFIQFVEWPERQPGSNREQPFRSVIVLGGGLSFTPSMNAELDRDGERVFSAAQLWHAGLVSSVICTGSASNGIGNPRDVGATLLESVGVPPQVIYKVPGENTTQEMQGLKKFFADPPDGFPASGELALITSAFHMHRAMRLASEFQLQLHPLPCAYRSDYFPNFSPRALIPSADAAADFGVALKERLGELVGR